MWNSRITRFMELKYFTKVTTMYSGVNSFNSCTNLISINTDNIKNLDGNTGGTGNNAPPLGSTGLTEIYLPNIVSLGHYSFKYKGTNVNEMNLSPLRTVVLGKSLSRFLGGYTLAYVHNINYFIYATTPPTSNEALRRTGITKPALMYVPDNSVTAYKESPTFSNWVDYIKPISEYEGDRPWEALYPEELGLS